MRAVQISRHGPPEVLAEIDADRPRPAPDQVLVRTAAAGVNFADLLQRLGLYASAPKPPYVPGFEVAGEVVGVGDDVEGLASGDRVVSLTRSGGYAELVACDAAAIMPLPPGVDPVTAAALPVTHLTAWFCLFAMGGLAAGKRVLVHGGAGGVGTAAVQLALDAGAEVIATAGSPRKCAFLQGQGVAAAVDYRATRFDDEIRRITGEDRPLDLVLDPVGGETTQRSYDLLAPLGRLVFYGMYSAVSGPRRNWPKALWALWKTPRFKPYAMIGDNTGVFGFHLAHLRGREAEVGRALAAIVERLEAGRLDPVVDRTFPLTGAGAADAHRHLHERRNIGKVLLVTGEPEGAVGGAGAGSAAGTEP